MMIHRMIEMCGLLMLAGASMNCATDNSGPATCAEAKTTYGVNTDGAQTLYVDGDKAMPWSAQCVGMATAKPREYLALRPFNKKTGKAANYASFVEGALAVTSHYDQVRIDPITLALDITDSSFVRDETTTSAAGDRISTILGKISVGYMPFGAAMACGAPAPSATTTGDAVGNIDLSDTPFELVTKQFCQDPQASAVSDQSALGQIVDFRATGSASTCAKASIACLPNPTVNGAVGAETTIAVQYKVAGSQFGF